MRNASRLTVGAVALGGALLFAPAASAQDACAYPFDPASPACSQTPVPPPPPPAGVESTDVGSTGTESTSTGSTGVASTGVASTGGAPTSVTSPSVARTLPFTGGELATLTLVGAGVLVGGVVLVSAARRKRA